MPGPAEPTAGADAKTAMALGVRDFDRVVREHQRQVYRVILGMVRDPGEAEALTQDVFVKAFERRDSFRGECAVGTWLVRIAINRVRDQARDRRWRFWTRLFRGSAEEPAGLAARVADVRSGPQETREAREQAAAVAEVVARLPVRQRAAFTLRYVEELSLEEIAMAMGCEVGTVKSHLSRATAVVRREVVP